MDYLAAIQTVFTPLCLLYVVLGVAVGMVVGTLPGLTSVMAISIITPLTFKMDSSYGFAMLLGVYNAAIFSGGISAIVINTPGTPASIATTFDGYTLTQNGRPGLGLGINCIYSVLGGLISTAILIVACEPLARFAINFGSAEFFWLTLFGLSMMVSVSSTNILKGLLLGCIGLMLGTVGLDPMLGIHRFTFGQATLMNGVSFVAVMIGVFGVGEVALQVFETKVSDLGKKEKLDVVINDSVFPTKEQHKEMAAPGLIGSIIGVIVGAIPGTGGDISSMISWDVCKRMSKKPEEYGKGSLEGISTTCASNNASIGGALTTALALGIPGDSNTAILLGALTMYGMVTGPTLLTKSADFVCQIYIIMIIANLLILALGLLSAKVCIKVLSVRKECIWVAVLLFCTIGSYSINRSFTDVLVMFIAGIAGFFLRKYDYPLGPVVLGLLLGEMCEENLRRGLTLSGGDMGVFFRGPICWTLIVLIFFALFWPAIAKLVGMLKAKK